MQVALAVACAAGPLLLTPVTTFSLELGEATIRSGLGQSLVVEIPYRLASNEQLSSGCIGLVPAPQAANALPTYTQVRRISLSSTHIEIFDDRRVREPLIGLNVSVHCATAPHFVRSYQLFVDPPARMPSSMSDGVAVTNLRMPEAIDTEASSPFATSHVASGIATSAAASSPTASVPTATTAPTIPSPRARGQAGGDLTQGQTYRVVRGDTLSGIAARVAERPATIRETADAIFAANPNAFARGNRDLIKEGQAITVPIMATRPATVSAPSTAVPLPAVREAESPAVSSTPTQTPTASTATPLRADDATSALTEPATEPRAASDNVIEPRTVLAPTPTLTERSTSTPSRTASSAWLTALLALGVIALLSVPLAFVRQRKRDAPAEIEKARPRRSVEPAAGIHVVERQLPRGDDAAATTGNTTVSLVPDAAVASPTDLALTVDPADPVDLDVGAPVVMNERLDWFAARASVHVADATSGDETIEENVATARMPTPDSTPVARPQSRIDSHAPIDDDQMTLTIVEIDMLRQDYEAEHTLTQHTSQALRDAVADLAETKAARAASAEGATLELPQPPQADATDSTARLQTARVRMK